METPYTWTCLAESAAFAPRDGAGLLSFRGWLWLIGGWNPADKAHFPRICSNDVWRSRDGTAWECVKPNTFGTAAFTPATDWAGRHTAGYAVHRGRMWLVGGDANQHVYQNDVWQSTDGIAWERVTDAVPWGPRVLHHTVAFADRLWVIGGQTLPTFAPAEERFYVDVWCSADGVHWECVQPSPPWPQRGMIGGAAIADGRMWLLGGGTYDTPGQPPAPLLQRRLEQRRRHRLAMSHRGGDLGAAPVPRGRRLGRPPVGARRLRRRQPQRRLALGRRHRLGGTGRHAVGAPSRRQRRRASGRPLGDRRQQHAKRRLAA